MVREAVNARLTLALTLGVLAGGVASAQAQVYTLTASLSGADETPAALNTGAFGTATITLDVGARSLTYRIDVFNLPSGVTASHTDCPEVNNAGFIQPGQSRSTTALRTARTCGFHDHNQPSNSALTGTIVIQ